MFLNELPETGITRTDLAALPTHAADARDHWRSGPAAAAEGWTAAGVRPRPEPIKPSALGLSGDGSCPYTEGMIVRHANYGDGRVIEVSGHGVLRKVKVRFRTHGERSFIAEKVKLEVVKG